MMRSGEGWEMEASGGRRRYHGKIGGSQILVHIKVGLFKHTAGLAPQSFWFRRPGYVPHICMLKTFPRDADAAGPGPVPRPPGIEKKT